MAIVTLWAIITITFILMHSVPGNPFANENKNIPDVVYQNLMRKYGLDKPYSEQYVIYLKNIGRGEILESLWSLMLKHVNEMIARGFPVSARLGAQALLIALIFGPALGAIAALHQNKASDYIAW